MTITERLRGAVAVLRGVSPAEQKLEGRFAAPWQQTAGAWPEGSVSDQLAANKSWVYACVTCRAENAAKARMRLYAKQGDNRDNWRELFKHPGLDVLSRVNAFMTRYELDYLTQQCLDLTGNAYWYIAPSRLGLPAEIWPLPPNRVRVVPGEKEFVRGYIYSSPGGMEKVALDASEVIHYKYPNPRDEFYGLSPVQAQYYAIVSNEAMGSYQDNVFRNGAFYGAVVTVPGELSNPEARTRILREFEEAHSGAQKAGKTMLAFGGMTVNPPKLGLKDLAMPELRNMNKEEILMAYRVPETMLGARGSNRAEADSLERSFSKGTILPLLKFREARLNEFFWPRYDNRLECEFEVDVPADKESELAERVAHLQNYVLSINEVRESQGLPRAPWGDVPLAPFNVGPLGSGGVPAVPPVQDMARASVSAGIHTCGHEHATGTPAVKDGQDGKWGTRAERDHLRETVWREIIDKMAPRERKLKAAVAGYFAGLRRVILRNLDKGVLEPDVVVPQAREQVERFGAEVEPYLREIMEAGFRDSVARAGGKVVNDKAVRAARSVEKFVLDFDVVAEAIATYFSDKWLPVVATVVIGNQLDQVRDELTAGLAAGESVGQLRGRMDDLFGSDPEHLTFVRTESMRAYNDAAILSYQAAGLEKMMWLTSQDDVVCDQCEPLDGTIWPVGGAALSIDHGLGEDVETGAQPPMPYHGNCRCVWEPVIDVPEA